MHKSLTPRTNLLLIFVWAAVVGTFVFAVTHPNKALVIGVGAVLGLLAGIFQLRALRKSKDRFRAATTLLEVRAAMTSSASGRLGIYTLYTAAVILLLPAYTPKGAIGVAWFAGYAAFAFVRESIALKGCIELQRTAESK